MYFCDDAWIDGLFEAMEKVTEDKDKHIVNV